MILELVHVLCIFAIGGLGFVYDRALEFTPEKQVAGHTKMLQMCLVSY